MNKITIKEIAKITGVSSATVSRVLNDNGRFSEETRKKVLSAIEKFDYQPNITAKSLRTSKSKTIGVIVPDITNEFFASVVLAIENQCLPFGYSVFICNTNEDEERESTYIKDLKAKGVDGLIYLSGKMDVPNDLIKAGIPVVCIDRNPNNENVVFIESDNTGGGYKATEELLKKGCKRIVMLKDCRDVSPMINRFQGYRNALADYGIEFNPDLILNTRVEVSSAQQAISELIRKGNPFDGIFAATDGLALGALLALTEHNVKVPDDVKLVGFDNISMSRYSSPPITTIHQNKEKLGTIAAENLLNLINKENHKNVQNNLVVPVELVIRKTT